jgi:hypothetical protein
MQNLTLSTNKEEEQMQPTQVFSISNNDGAQDKPIC